MRKLTDSIHLQVSKKLPCGHTEKAALCHVPIENIKCSAKCRRAKACGHFCKKLCYEPCGDCNAPVIKAAPCGHELRVKK